jgi:hypothetical protein
MAEEFVSQGQGTGRAGSGGLDVEKVCGGVNEGGEI